jgi:Carboxypeptidase regulatory-like domain
MSTKIAVILLAAFLVRAQDRTGSVTGIVRDQAGAVFSSRPLDLESPNGFRLHGQTDYLGVYRFGNLPAGEYIFDIYAPGFSWLRIKFDLSSGEQKSLPTIILEVGSIASCGHDTSVLRFLASGTSTGSLAGTVRETSEEASPPVAGVKVTLRCKSGDSCGRTTVTDSRGQFIFGNLSPGPYGLGFNNPGFSDSGYQVKAGIETSYSIGLRQTPAEKARGPVVCE